MFNKFFLYLKNFDWILFSAVLLLICFGLAEIYSIALGQGVMDLLNFKKQIFFVIIGLLLLFGFAFLDYNVLRNYSNYFFILGVIILLGVLLSGQTIKGTKGWFYIKGFGLQPVEFVKFVLILFLARYFSSASIKINPLKHILITGSGVLIFVILVLAQPDFGSALILFLLWMAMVSIIGLKKKYLFIITLILTIAMALSWGFFFKDYQKHRIITFLNPSFNPLNQGYNISQAIIAVGAGGLTGRGLGLSFSKAVITGCMTERGSQSPQ